MVHIYITERRHKMAALRESLGMDLVVTVYVVQSGAMNAELSRPYLLATVQSGRTLTFQIVVQVGIIVLGGK